MTEQVIGIRLVPVSVPTERPTTAVGRTRTEPDVDRSAGAVGCVANYLVGKGRRQSIAYADR